MPKNLKAPTSGKVRSYDWTWFRCLTVGQQFRWASDIEGWGTCGLCTKTSDRKYTYQDKDGKTVEGKVGSINAHAIKVDAEGEPVRVGEYVPYLGD